MSRRWEKKASVGLKGHCVAFGPDNDSTGFEYQSIQRPLICMLDVLSLHVLFLGTPVYPPGCKNRHF